MLIKNIMTMVQRIQKVSPKDYDNFNQRLNSIMSSIKVASAWDKYSFKTRIEVNEKAVRCEIDAQIQTWIDLLNTSQTNGRYDSMVRALCQDGHFLQTDLKNLLREMQKPMQVTNNNGRTKIIFVVQRLNKVSVEAIYNGFIRECQEISSIRLSSQHSQRYILEYVGKQ